ncbi:RelA/SpoT domain-containing protein [Klebsiella variicola]|uniref:RelA/SpoT domain-containing protein n=1 Tax=Klebsiella variicola TaxID=244366 RepID=UPI00203C5FFA|nr:RelA/SpoT domain-containing protein [Klebsiella variicola]USC08410.1 RelA/SpoT domain-containing protein [Klebsiella variicola]
MKNDPVNIVNLELEEFLDNNHLTKEQFHKADFLWEDLKEIGLAHYNNISALSETAGLISSILQQGENVHSVRWRIKDPEHLMSKIIRKRNEDEISEKYRLIKKDNYTDVITDLIGIRVLHLFKEDWKTIHEYLYSKWEFQEAPIVYIRDGDTPDVHIADSIEKIHPAGYRSVHYIISTRLLKNNVYTEIQVRTIFEEAWSEIDHHVRYPNFKNNEILNYFLLIFNRFAGGADEMGTFVLSLKNELKASIERSIKISEIEKEKETYLAKIDELVSNLEDGQKLTSETKNELKQVKQKLELFQRKENDVYNKPVIRSLNTSSLVGDIVDFPSSAHIEFSKFNTLPPRDIVSKELIDSILNNEDALKKIGISLDSPNTNINGRQKKTQKK